MGDEEYGGESEASKREKQKIFGNLKNILQNEYKEEHYENSYEGLWSERVFLVGKNKERKAAEMSGFLRKIKQEEVHDEENVGYSETFHSMGEGSTRINSGKKSMNEMGESEEFSMGMGMGEGESRGFETREKLQSSEFEEATEGEESQSKPEQMVSGHEQIQPQNKAADIQSMVSNKIKRIEHDLDNMKKV